MNANAQARGTSNEEDKNQFGEEQTYPNVINQESEEEDLLSRGGADPYEKMKATTKTKNNRLKMPTRNSSKQFTSQ